MGELGALSKKLDKATGSDIQNTHYLRGSDDPQDYGSRSLNTRLSPSNVSGEILIYDFVPELIGDANQKKGVIAKYNQSMSNASMPNRKSHTSSFRKDFSPLHKKPVSTPAFFMYSDEQQIFHLHSPTDAMPGPMGLSVNHAVSLDGN